MLEQIIKHKYFFHIVAIIVILAAALLFIVFSGNSAETDNTANVQESAEELETQDVIDQPPSAHWSNEEPGWGTESQDE